MRGIWNFRDGIHRNPHIQYSCHHDSHCRQFFHIRFHHRPWLHSLCDTLLHSFRTGSNLLLDNVGKHCILCHARYRHDMCAGNILRTHRILHNDCHGSHHIPNGHYHYHR